MGHQDKDLELRSMLEEDAVAEKKAPEAEAPPQDTPLAIDHDVVRSWRETARFFRKAA